jgi:hypothetical protein
MNEKNEIYEQIAIEQRMLFDWFRGTEIFIKLRGDDPDRLYRFRDICGGEVVDGAYNQIIGRHTTNWGRYAWYMEGEEAYQFCLGIRRYLNIYDPKRHGWCQQCINVHEDRRHQSTGT